MKIASLILAVLVTAVIGCDKPTDEQCRKAVDNIRRLTGTANSDFGADPEAAVRSCKGNASKESVLCMIEAKTIEELRKCEGEASDQYIREEEEAEKKRREEWEKQQQKGE